MKEAVISANGPFKTVVAHSVAWTMVRILSEQASLFVVFAVLTRLLPPAAFGAISIAVIFVEVAKLIASNGIAEAVVQAPDLDEAVADTAFWANLALSTATAAMIAAVAYPVAALMKAPELAHIMLALAVVPIINAAGVIHMARTTRAFGHKALAFRSLVANLIGGVVSIALALLGFGLWALVVQRIVAETLLTVASWVALPWRPRLRFVEAKARDLVGYGFHVATTGLIFLLSSRVHEFVVGATVSLAAVGVLRIGFRLTDLITQFVVRPFSTVASPAFGRLRDDQVRFRAGYHRLQATCAAVAFPAFIGVGALGTELVPLLFGEAWRASADIVRVLTLLVVPIVTNYFVTPALYAKGRPAVAVRIALVQLALGTVACLVAAPFGVLWVAIAYVARAWITMPYVLWMLRREADVDVRGTVRVLVAPLGASLIMGAFVLAFMTATRAMLAPIPQVIVGIVIGALIYPVLLFLLDRHTVRAALETARGTLGRGANPVA